MGQLFEEQKIINKWQDKIKRGFLWIIILRLYDQNITLSGTEIKVKINEIVKNWDPSPGSIYPILKELEQDGLIAQVKNSDKKNKLYCITKRGSNLLIVLRNEVFAFRMHPIEFLKRMGENESEFKSKFGLLKKNMTFHYLYTLNNYLKNIITWIEDIINQTKHN